MATIKSKSVDSTKKVTKDGDNITDEQQDDVKTKSNDSSKEEPGTNEVQKEPKQDDSDQNQTKDSEDSENEDESNSQDIDWKAQARKWEKLAKKNLKNAKTDDTDATDDVKKADEEESDASVDASKAANDELNDSTNSGNENTDEQQDGNEQSDGSQDIETRLADLQSKYDDLVAEKEHSALVQQVSESTDVPPQVISMLSGPDEETLMQQANKLKQLMKTPSSSVVSNDGYLPSNNANATSPELDFLRKLKRNL